MVARLKKPEYPFVIVVWDDAISRNSIDSITELKHNGARVYTAGWLLKEDETGISIASEWILEDNSWRDITFVPKGMLVEVVKK